MQLSNTLELILYKAYTDLKAESARSYLGFMWWILEPVLYLCAFYVLFVLVLQRGGPNFVPNFLCGVVVWKWFASGIQGGAQAINANLGLLQQVYVPKFIFPVITVLGSTARFLPVFGIFIIFLLLYGIPFHATWLAVPIVMLAQFCLVISLAMLVGAITPFLPDLKTVIDNGIMLLFFISGVFYDINEVQEPLKSYLLLNPMVGLIDEYRNIMIRGIWPDTLRLAIIMGSSIVLGTLALVLLKRLDHRYGKVPF
ncbi:ABC transporter permease [Gammaproteobacteria bacterium]|nr:ABC transporter permease [Gammaproteobacteria bacterium]